MWDILQPVIANTIALIVTALIGMAANSLRQKFNIEIEQSYRDSLHSAIMSGVNAALARAGTLVEPLSAPMKVQLIDEAMNYANRSVPDAISALKATPEILGNLAASKLNQIATEQQSQQPIVVATTTPAVLGEQH